jgi:lipoprotein-anchoring transpeptidase ErfK/SrfK
MIQRALAAFAVFFAALPASGREVVIYDSSVEPGTIVVRTKERRLYLVVEYCRAIRYRVAVGKPGKQWQGWTQVSGKHVEPDWSPPDEIKRDNPRLPAVIPGGSPKNPMGSHAMTLAGTQYAIHGTNQPGSIGTSASYGCIRMYNDDIADLYERVNIGTAVVVSP